MTTYPLDRQVLHMTIALCLGIFLCGADMGIFWRAFLVLVGMGALFACRRGDLLQRAFFIGGAFILGFAVMALHLGCQTPLAPLADRDRPLTVAGHVTASEVGKSWLHMTLDEVNGQVLNKPLMVRVKKTYGDEDLYRVGDRVRISGILARPEVHRNPGGFDERDFLFSKGIHYVLRAREPGQVLMPAHGFAAWLNQANEAIDRTLDTHLSPDHKALVAAVLFGDVDGIHDDFYAYAQRIGIIHIFSVSGLHVGFIVAFILGLARLLGRQHSPWLLVLMAPLLGLYVVLSQASPPAMRAALMALVALLAIRLLRHKDLMVIIGMVAFVLLVPAPYLFWDIGFRLSFLITFGIVYGYGAVERALAFLPQGLRQALALALTAELVSAPLVAWYFYVFAPLSVVANLVIVPLFSVLVPLALVAILLAQISYALGVLVFFPARVLMDILLAMIQGAEALIGSAHIYLGQPPLPLLILYGILLGLLFSGRLRVRHGEGVQALGFGVLLILLINFYTPLDKDRIFTVLDVGQGSGAVARTPGGDWLVFDTGPAKDTVASFLRYGACNRVEALVLSHGDSDHIHGLRHIVRDFHVDHLLVEPQALAGTEWESLVPLINRRGVEVHILDRGATYDLGPGSSLTMDYFYDSQASGNQSMLVARLEMPGFSIMIPGDVAPQHFRAPILAAPVDVVLVPHHGSKANWSQEFYEATQPRLAVVSAGRDNRFGHPHDEILRGLEGLGIPLVRTDQGGAISLYQTSQGLAYEVFCTSE